MAVSLRPVWAGAMVFATLVSGCGGASVDQGIANLPGAIGEPFPNATSLAEAAGVLNDEFEPLFNTTFSAMPTTGTAQFNGFAAVLIGTPEQHGFMGEATITADYQSGTVTGGADNFFDLERRVAAGSLTLSNGVIGVERPNDFQARLTGQLDGIDGTLAPDMVFEGDFVATPVRGVRGVAVGSYDYSGYVGVPTVVAIIAEE